MKIMIINELTIILVSGAFLKCFSIVRIMYDGLKLDDNLMSLD